MFMLSALLARAEGLPKLDPNKFTVCAITINSDNEKKVFEEQIKKNPKEFNPIIELTTLGDGGYDDNWFEKACASGVSCDQLVVSGHFGGTFFGASGKQLSLSELESKGCSKSCEGILSHPYEVFLFGCNTLATKEQDHRTPEQYLQVLLDDGIPRDQAEQVVEARYGATGDDNRSRMQRAFGGEKKQLFGFSSVGPSGSNVEGFLKNYFKKINIGTHLQTLEAKRLVEKTEFVNTLLGNALKGTAFFQCPGGDFTKKDQTLDEKTQIICGLRDSNETIEKKLALVSQVFARKDYLSFVPAINEFFQKHPPETMTAEQKNKFRAITGNETIKSQMLGLINNTKSLLLAADWIEFSGKLGFIDATKERELLSARVNSMFEKNLSVTDKDLLCSLNMRTREKIDLDWDRVEKLEFSDNEYQAVSCLANPKMSRNIQLKLLKRMDKEGFNTRPSIASAFCRFKPQDKDIQLT